MWSIIADEHSYSDYDSKMFYNVGVDHSSESSQAHRQPDNTDINRQQIDSVGISPGYQRELPNPELVSASDNKVSGL